ncbi:MAG TPA: hypothetical protein VK700_09850, partial [Steroidobacteraceae bacterium]|nr:hypothetical protein [Steroidobacteraceae bacterium]
SISVNVTDSFGNTATKNITVAVTALQPVITAPASATVLQGNASGISGVSVAETSTVAGETFTATLTDTNGVLSATGGTSSNGGHTVTITGATLAALNTDLASLSDTDASSAADSISVNVTDSFGNAAATKNITVAVTALQPVITAPASATVQQSSATAVTGVSLAETSNVSGETFTTTLTDTNGILSVTAGGATVTGNASKSVTISGSLTQVDAALASLSDNDATAGADSITVNGSDSFGNTAAPKSIAVTVAPSGVVGWAAPVSGNWNTAGNWNPKVVPGSAVQAVIAVAGTYTVTSSQANTVGSLNLSNSNATLAITNSSTFTINDQPASTNAGTIAVGDGSTLDLAAGGFANSGTIALGSLTHATGLGISGSVTLSGGGQITLANADSSVLGVAAGASLTNANDTISGAGTVGNANLTLTNGGTIQASGGALTVNTGTNTINNNGVMETGAGATMVVASAVSGTGSDQISGGSTMEFKTSVGAQQSVSFSGTGDTLKLDLAQDFAGTLQGMAAPSSTSFDAVDLGNFKFAYTSITSVTQQDGGAAGTYTDVTLTDSADHLTVTLQLLNQTAGEFGASASDYSLTSDRNWIPGTDFSVNHLAGTPNTGIGH